MPEKPIPPPFHRRADSKVVHQAVLEAAEQSHQADQNKYKVNLFATEAAAREYLRQRVPPIEKDRPVDLTLLKERLFQIPEHPTAGHYDFDGKNDFHVSFDLVSADGEFDRCWLLYKDAKGIEGNHRPIFIINNLQIQTANFYYDVKELARPIGITWLPGLRSNRTELTSVVAYRGDQRDVYLMGEVGWQARSIDLLGLFHEFGHSETRSPEDKTKEEDSVRTRITRQGVQREPLKKAALELQRELDANSWMLQTAGQLFDDLKVPRELITDYIEHWQMRSYYEACRKKLAQSTE